MRRFPNFDPSGVIPACILPFHDDLSLDLRAFRKHLVDVASVEGLSAITVNAHSTEVASCTSDEQRLVMQAAAEAIGDRLPIIHGVYAEGSLDAARIARSHGLSLSVGIGTTTAEAYIHNVTATSKRYLTSR